MASFTKALVKGVYLHNIYKLTTVYLHLKMIKTFQT